MFYHVSGTSRVSSFLALAAPAAAADAMTDVYGDGAGPSSSIGDDTASVTVTDDHVVAPLSTWSLPSTIATAFMARVGINPNAWEDSKRLGPSTTSVV